MIVVCVEVKWSPLACVTIAGVFITSFFTPIVRKCVLVAPESAIALTKVGFKRVKNNYYCKLN